MNRKITELRPHPKNLEIYGIEQVSDDFLSSIKAKGVMVPLTVKADGTIISGHRRYEAAKLAGLESVPVGIATFDNELDELEALIEFNRQREKTFSQKMKEAEALELIEGERAKKRMAAAGASAAPGKAAGKGKEILPDLSQGQTRDKVAKQIGIGSGKTYDVAKEIYKKSEAGDEAAKEVVRKLDKKEITIHGAKKEFELKNTVVHVSNNSGENEWYTPSAIIEAARHTMESIDTDPASCELANKTVKAKRYYDAEANGLEKAWAGNVWLNPPYAQPLISQFMEKVVEKYKKKEFESCCILVNNATETRWFQMVLKIAKVVCFPESRIKFIDKTGKPTGAPLQGQAIIGIGVDVDRFKTFFGVFGVTLTNE